MNHETEPDMTLTIEHVSEDRKAGTATARLVMRDAAGNVLDESTYIYATRGLRRFLGILNTWRRHPRMSFAMWRFRRAHH